MSHIARQHRRNHARTGRRAGFTLLEILLTVLLSAVLLTSLWGLLAVYSRLFETGQTRAERAQLTAGLLQQISDDLHAAIQDTAEAPPSALGPVRRFGLFGSATVLQIDVRQAVWPRRDPTPTTDILAALETSQVPQANELRTIRYTFAPPVTDDQAVAETRPGLTRQELDFETPYAPGNEPAVANRVGAGDGPAAQPEADKPPDELSLLESLGPDPNDDAITWIPEVVSLEFHYFDGLEWSSTWNSIQRRSLPVAIEVLLEFEAEDRTARASAAPPPPPADEPMDLLALDEASTQPPGTQPCRLVVYLSTSALAQRQIEERRAASLDSWMSDLMPDEDDALLEDLAANPTDPADEAGNLELARAFQGIGRRAARRRPMPDDPGVRRPVIDQPAPDEWMRAGPMSR